MNEAQSQESHRRQPLAVRHSWLRSTEFMCESQIASAVDFAQQGVNIIGARDKQKCIALLMCSASQGRQAGSNEATNGWAVGVCRIALVD